MRKKLWSLIAPEDIYNVARAMSRAHRRAQRDCPPTNAKQQHIRIDKPCERLFTTLLCLNTCKFKAALNPVEHLGSYHYQSLPPLSHHFKNCPLSAPMSRSVDLEINEQYRPFLF